MPERLKKPQIVLRTSDSQVQELEQQRWAAPFGAELRDALSADLADALSAVDVGGATPPAGVPLYRIGADVQRLDARPGQDVSALVTWRVSRDAATPGQQQQQQQQQRIDLPDHTGRTGRWRGRRGGGSDAARGPAVVAARRGERAQPRSAGQGPAGLVPLSPGQRVREAAELRQRRLHLGRVRQAEADAEVVVEAVQVGEHRPRRNADTVRQRRLEQRH